MTKLLIALLTAAFAVSPAVLIPRPETETLVTRVLDLCREAAAPMIVDVGTGSGAIAVTLAKHLPRARITASDGSQGWGQLAPYNAGISVEMLHSTLARPLIGREWRRSNRLTVGAGAANVHVQTIHGDIDVDVREED